MRRLKMLPSRFANYGRQKAMGVVRAAALRRHVRCTPFFRFDRGSFRMGPHDGPRQNPTRRRHAMKDTRVSVLVGVLGAMVLLCATAIADPGNAQDPQRKPTRPPSSSNEDHGKGSCVSACGHIHRDCSKKATSDRKTCYAQTCAPKRATVEACDGGGPGHGSEDGVTDQGTGCDAAAQALKLCLQDCRAAFNASRLSCAQAARACKIDCGLPLRTPTPTPGQ
jgi:hypothetical protein